MSQDNKAPSSGGKSYSKPKSKFGRGGFKNRKKVCPFIMDKELTLDYKNMKIIYRFVTDTGKIVPRRVSGVTAKSQRKLCKHIKRARNIGFIAPAIDT